MTDTNICKLRDEWVCKDCNNVLCICELDIISANTSEDM